MVVCALVMDRRIDRFIFIPNSRVLSYWLNWETKSIVMLSHRARSLSPSSSILVMCILEHSGTFDYYAQRHWLLSLSLHNRSPYIYGFLSLYSVRCHCFIVVTWWLNSTIEFKWIWEKKKQTKEKGREREMSGLSHMRNRQKSSILSLSEMFVVFFSRKKEIEKNQFQSYCSTVRKIEPNLE